MAMEPGRRTRDTARRLALQSLAEMYPGQYRMLYEGFKREAREADGLTPPHLRQDINAQRGANGHFQSPVVPL